MVLLVIGAPEIYRIQTRTHTTLQVCCDQGCRLNQDVIASTVSLSPPNSSVIVGSSAGSVAGDHFGCWLLLGIPQVNTHICILYRLRWEMRIDNSTLWGFRMFEARTRPSTCRTLHSVTDVGVSFIEKASGTTRDRKKSL